MKTEQFRVPDVSCEHCIHAITKEVTALPGITHVTVELSDKTVTVQHDAQVDTAAIVAAINEAGYDEVAQLN